VSGGDEDAALTAIAAAPAAAVGASDNSHDLGKINEDDEGDEDSSPKPAKTSAGAGVGVGIGAGGAHTAANRRTSGRVPSVLALHKTNHMALLQLSGSVDAQGRPFKKTFAFFDGEACTDETHHTKHQCHSARSAVMSPDLFDHSS
jgi:hypothetical protein